MSEVQGGNAGMDRLRLILLLSHGFTFLVFLFLCRQWNIQDPARKDNFK